MDSRYELEKLIKEMSDKKEETDFTERYDELEKKLPERKEGKSTFRRFIPLIYVLAVLVIMLLLIIIPLIFFDNFAKLHKSPDELTAKACTYSELSERYALPSYDQSMISETQLLYNGDLICGGMLTANGEDFSAVVKFYDDVVNVKIEGEEILVSDIKLFIVSADSSLTATYLYNDVTYIVEFTSDGVDVPQFISHFSSYYRQ